jgi:hypothetical protein
MDARHRAPGRGYIYSACPRKCIEVGPLQPWPGPFPCTRLQDAQMPRSHLHLLRGAPPAHSPLARARARSPTSCKSHSNGLQGWASGFGNSTIGMVRVTASDSETLSTDY